MLSTVLLLLSLLTVQCGGCDFDQISVENIKATIDSNPTGFVIMSCIMHANVGAAVLFCPSPQCCVFPAAVVLQDSWAELLPNLWEEHVNYSLIVELMATLNTIIKNNENLFQEETDLAQFSTVRSSPEELLNLTSELFTQWLKVACSPSVETCPMPTLPPSVEKKDDRPPRPRLSTRAVNNAEKMMSVPNASFRGLSLPVYDFSSVWSLLLFGLYWWLLPQ
uniref:Uncharacterized protein n=1 Tax=Oryzias sinensis TaxID=183150 RepID=A0A8C7WZB4_9TELE